LGFFGGRFLHCGMFLFFLEILGSESLAFVSDYVLALVLACPNLLSLGYDDGCHLAEVLRSHPHPLMRALAIWIDLSHIAGHVRPKCFLEHHPVLHLLQATQTTLTIYTEPLRDKVLRCLDADGTVRHHATFCALAGINSGGASLRLVTVGTDSATGIAEAIVAFLTAPLPAEITLSTPDGSEHIFVLSHAHRRLHFIRMLNVAEGRLHRKTQIQGVRLPKHTRLVSWRHTGLGAPPAVHLVSRPEALPMSLRRHALPVTLAFVPKWNTSVAEQGWTYLNRHKHTVRMLDSESAVLLIHRLGHLFNWNRRDELLRTRP
jgi:hypothetical protein